MRLDTAFRLSFYATLAVACLSLGYAEIYFLPWMLVVAVLAIGLIAVAYRQEGRWALNEQFANILGLVIGAASLGWIYFQLPRSEEELLARGVPWPAGLLPHVGPLLMGLLLVKLFRPKQPVDFWSIQIIGLMMITLGCVLTGEVLFGVLLVAYFACVLWSLGLFYAYRQQFACRKPTAMSVSFLADGQVSGKPGGAFVGLGQAFGRASVLLPLGFLLFLLAPRRTDSEWIPYKLSTTRDMGMRTGAPTDIDLNRVGNIELSENPAFTVKVTNGEGEPIELFTGQRFRSNTADHYRNGRWQRLGRVFSRDTRGTHIRLRVNAEIPDLGAKQLRLDFEVNPHTAGNFVLAEPVILGAEPGEFPYVRLDDVVSRNLFFELIGTGTLMPFPNPLNRPYRYRQSTLPQPENRRVAARHVSSDYVRFLQTQRVFPEVSAYTVNVLQSLTSLSEDERQLNAKDEVPRRHQQKVAIALEQHLLTSGEFGYSLNLRRANVSLDPTVDFLLNVKRGHCERFAAALALMLRSVGIPTRLVSGFRGAELLSPGHYEIREKHAHSWVEALVGDDDDPTKLYWLSLDPTPDTELAEQSFVDWLRLNWNNGHTLWRDLVLEYNTIRQAQAFIALWEGMRRPETWIDVGVCLLCILGGVAGLFLLRRWRAYGKQRQALADGSFVPFYQRFLDVAERRFQLKPAAEQTPREFAQVAAQKLAALSFPVAVVDIPNGIVSLLYRVRYGGRKLTGEELVQVNQALVELDSVLKMAH